MEKMWWPLRLIASTVRDTFLNWHLGQGSFDIQRLTGLILTGYLVMHIGIISTGLAIWGGAETFNGVMEAMHNRVILVMEILLILCVVFHMLNGLRITVVDFFSLSKLQNKMLWWTGVATILLMLYVIWGVLPRFAEMAG
jgi:succinate dehydrogenase / fumarate reductase cytochrome b subunit